MGLFYLQAKDNYVRETIFFVVPKPLPSIQRINTVFIYKNDHMDITLKMRNSSQKTSLEIRKQLSSFERYQATLKSEALCAINLIFKTE